MINRVVPLRNCSDTVFYNRQRPCLEHQIKRCAAPCCLEVDPNDYRRWVKEAMAILDGRTSELERELTRRMEKASDDLRFEDAADLRDRIEILKNNICKTFFSMIILKNKMKEGDICGLYEG